MRIHHAGDAGLPLEYWISLVFSNYNLSTNIFAGLASAECAPFCMPGETISEVEPWLHSSGKKSDLEQGGPIQHSRSDGMAGAAAIMMDVMKLEDIE